MTHSNGAHSNGAHSDGANSSGVGVVLALMKAFQDQDREQADALLADDFVFTSPQDDHIDKATWLERCFPTADHFEAPSTTLQIAEIDGVVLHRYEYRVDGVRWRNAEASRVAEGRVREVEVYFGGAVDPAQAPDGGKGLSGGSDSAGG